MTCSGKYGSRSTRGRSGPASTRAGNVGVYSRQPVAAAIRPAARTPASVSPLPSIMSSVSESIRGAMDATAASSTVGLATDASKPGALARTRPSPQAQSTGTMSVAMPPRGMGFGASAARTASTASRARPSEVRDVRIQVETGFATLSMSEVSGAS